MDERRYRGAVTDNVAALADDIRHFVVDLEYAWDTRDWAELARVYRQIAAIADRLEEIDPDARSRVLARASLREASLYEAESASLEGIGGYDEADEIDEADEPGATDG